MIGNDFWRWLGSCTQLQIAVSKLASERELLPLDCGCLSKEAVPVHPKKPA